MATSSVSTGPLDLPPAARRLGVEQRLGQPRSLSPAQPGAAALRAERVQHQVPAVDRFEPGCIACASTESPSSRVVARSEDDQVTAPSGRLREGVEHGEHRRAPTTVAVTVPSPPASPDTVRLRLVQPFGRGPEQQHAGRFGRGVPAVPLAVLAFERPAQLGRDHGTVRDRSGAVGDGAPGGGRHSVTTRQVISNSSLGTCVRRRADFLDDVENLGPADPPDSALPGPGCGVCIAVVLAVRAAAAADRCFDAASRNSAVARCSTCWSGSASPTSCSSWRAAERSSRRAIAGRLGVIAGGDLGQTVEDLPAGAVDSRRYPPGLSR